ncbi:hypothetical protein CXB51_003352 [Gossypium anomalum]|uniref:Transposase-associated domain-containing protein n=1 Tax=Gossypium anomalum TaxID=47600 RepID=A0A8J5Z774_9ROSI|nr:hypothetical protein CXB51_003352 [Gossypium anomalum]
MIICPCKKCGNIYWHFREVVYEHLIVDGFIRGYKKWTFHGECTTSGTSSTINPTYPDTDYHQHVRQDDMEDMLRDAFNMRSHGEQSFPHDFIISEDCNIGGMFFAKREQGDQKNQQSCHVCGKSRWMNSNTEDVNTDEGGAQLRKKPVKVLRYFPLIPRLQRLFMSSKTAESMRWHNDQWTDDGLLRHPADSLAWKSFDSKFPSFASDPRNVRLGLAADGFNPFKIMSTSYSTWPVVLVPYNLPPWICMKQFSFILSMIIPGEKGPGNDIDIYLQPLIEELKQLWSGVEAYDVLRKENYNLRVALLWTINDFPAYANLSGWSTKGRYACPCCAAQTCSKWLYNGKKFSYMGHRRWLDENHKFRFQRTLFDGTEEYRGAPEQTIGSEILFMLKDINFSYGKMNQPPITQKGEDRGMNLMMNLTKRMILMRRSCGRKGNVCENIIGTILNVDGKSKDNLQSRLDLVDMRIRRDLHPQVLPNGKYRLPPSIFSMLKKEKEVFCMVLKDIKVPDAYASNISRCVSFKDRRLYSLKSHDYHILMQDLLPIALWCCMSKNVTSCIIELSNIMKAICGKVLNVEELEKVQDRAALTLCNLEKIFPPSFFTIMVHLVIHLPRSNPWWTGFLSMDVSHRKSYCRNKRYPEGSIAEGYLAEECMTFCSRYLEDAETRLNRPSRNAGLNDHDLAETYLFQSYGEPIGKVEIVWSGKDVNDEIKWLSQGPNRVIKRYSAFLINGYRFHTKYRERMRRTQNCGVVVNSSITSYASARDSNPVEGNVEYYGLLTDIIELDYYGRWKVILFGVIGLMLILFEELNRSIWFYNGEFLSLDSHWTTMMDEPYVFSSQVKQVFYSKDPTDEGWYVVHRNTPRDLFDMGNGSRDDIVERSETLPFPEQNLDENIPRKMRRRRLRGLSIVQNTPNSEEGNSEQQTAVGSSNVPETLDEPEEFQIENGGTRRVRGRTLLSDLYDLDPANRVKVSRNTYGQPVGSEARLLAGYIGILARNANMLPINYESWHHMPDSNKNQALANIKDRFALEVSDDYIKKKLGSRSFASVAEAEEVKSGQKVGRLQLFEITHKKKDGSPMTSEAGEIMEKLKDKKAEYEATTSTDSSVNLENIDNRIITEVLGPERYGRVRFQGSGVTPTQYFGSGSQQYMPSGSQAKVEVQRLRDQIAQMQANTVEQIAEVQRKYEELQQQLRAEAAEREAAAAAREAEHRKKYDDLQLQLQQMMQMFQQSQKPPS